MLLLTIVKGWLWASVFPPLQSSDEIHHIGYARDIARYGSLAVEPRGVFIPEEVVALDIAQTTKVSGYRRPIDLSPARVREIERAKLLLRNPAEQPSSSPKLWVPFFSRQHPPLYYAMGALLEIVARPPDLLEHLALGRLVSVIISVITVGLAYLLAREIFPTRPHLWLATAIVVGFLPMVTYLGSVYTNQALEIALFTAISWMIAQVLRCGINWPRALGLGLGLSLGLLTKVSLMVAVPLVFVVASYDLLRARAGRLAWVLVFALPVLLASNWYVNYLGVTNGGGRHIVRREGALGFVSLFAFMRSLPLGRILLQLWNESVASFGHRDTLLPRPLYMMSLISLGLAVVGWGRKICRVLARGRKPGSELPRGYQWFAIGVLSLACLGFCAFYFSIAYLRSHGGRLAGLQGRHLVVVVAGFTLALLVGWLNLASRYWRWLLALVVVLCVTLNTYCLLDRVIWRYYGSQQELAIDSRDVLSAPLTIGHKVSQCLAFDEMRLNRLDVWLQRESPRLPGELRLSFIDGEGRPLMESRNANLGWVMTYPACFRFAPLEVSGELCLTLQGGFDGEVQVWATQSSSAGSWFDGDQRHEGSLALRLYRPVSWREIPGRIAIQSARLYTPGFYWTLGSVYAFGLLGFLAVYLRRLLGPHTGWVSPRSSDAHVAGGNRRGISKHDHSV